jgi:glycine cleavage system H protein
MAMIVWERKYTKDHEWVELSPDKSTYTVGITAYAAQEIGDITWVELPEPDTTVDAEETLCVIESVKAANDIYAPMSGTVVESNAKVSDDPKLVNEDSEGDGWIAKLKVEAPEQYEALLNKSDYEAMVKDLKAEAS